MNLLVLYLLLLKAALTSFSRLTSLPVVRHDFVETRQLLTDRQLNASVAAGRTAPGPNGLYLVSVGFYVAGYGGAAAGCAALMTPAFFIFTIMRFVGSRAPQPRVRSAIQCVTIAAAGLIIDTTIPMARDAITGWFAAAIAVAAFFFLVLTNRPTVWVMLAAAFAGWISAA
jgi:chromate transporter